MTPHEHNLESRKETLTALFNRIITDLSILPAEDAVSFTSPLCDILLRVAGELQDYRTEKEGDAIIKQLFPDHKKEERLNERAQSHIKFLDWTTAKFSYDEDEDCFYEKHTDNGISEQKNSIEVYLKYVVEVLM